MTLSMKTYSLNNDGFLTGDYDTIRSHKSSAPSIGTLPPAYEHGEGDYIRTKL